MDLGPTFSPESEHLDGLLERRDEIVRQRVPIGVSYLDDCLGGLYPGDLLLLGAATGVGKTGLAVHLSRAGVRAGRRVYGLFLEAAPGEVSARLVYGELARRAQKPEMDFASWWRGQWREQDRRYWGEVKDALEPELSQLNTLYKGRGDFTPKNLKQQLEEIANDAEMVVLDHIHVVDTEASHSELRTQRKTVELLRDLALVRGIPVVAISHLRKRSQYERSMLMPDLDDMHGSSELSKKGTQAVLVARDWDGPRPEPHLAPTLMKVPKDRWGRASTMVARVYYDLRRGQYRQEYELGRIVIKDKRQQWERLDKIPRWAKREARNQTQLPF